MLVVQLNKDERTLVEKISKERTKHDRRVGRKDLLRAHKNKARFIEVNGLGGEYAVAKALNLYPDINTQDISNYDLILPDGRKLEIKTTEYKTGRLIIKTKNRADLYILVTGTMPSYTVVGYIKADEVNEHWKKWGKEHSFVIEQDQLHPIEELLTERYLSILEEHNHHEKIKK